MDINWNNIIYNITKNSPKKHLGQNFLTNYEIIKNILKSVQLHDNILEIGPGSGILSYGILEFMAPGGSLTLIEKDKNFIEPLELLLEPLAQKKSIDLKIIQGDGLLYESSTPVQVISNIPYNLSSNLFYKWLSNPEIYPSLVIMVQKEFGEKLWKNPHNNLGFLCQSLGSIKKIMDLKASNFKPIPSVDSQVIYYINAINDKNFVKNLKELLNEIFSHPRKQLKNNIISEKFKNFMEINHYNHLRPENLNPNDCRNWVLSTIK